MFMNFYPKDSAGSISRPVRLTACLIGLLTPSMAHAGFEWTPPPAPVVQAAPADAPQVAAPSGPLTPEPDAPPVPVGNVETAPVAQHNDPLVVDNAPAAPTPAPAAEELPAPTPAPVTPAPVTAPPADDVVEGFGKDIPLAMALRDIVPAKYAYSFTPRDVAGVKISWRGGKPWQDVLAAALVPYDLGMNVTDTTIVIFAKQYSATPAPAPAPAPSAPPSASVVVPSESAPTQPQTLTSADPLPLAPAEPVAAQTTARQANDARPVMTAMDVQSNRKWQARPGTTLRQTLEGWAKDSNVELNWSTPYDYPINNAFYFDGTFTQAVDSLLSSYGGENPSPKGRLYPNLPEGPSVLMVN